MRLSLYLLLVFCVFQVKANDPIEEIRSLLEKSKNQSGREELNTLVQANELLYNRLYDIDSLTLVISKKALLLNDTKTYLKALEKYCWAENYLGFYHRTDSVFKVAYPLLIENGDSILLSDFLIHKALSERRQMKFSAAKRHLVRAGENYRKYDEIKKLGRWHLAYASLNSSEDDFELALQNIQQSLSIADSLDDYVSQSSGFLFMAGLSGVLNHSEEVQIGNLKKALKACELGDNCLEKGMVLMNLSGYYTGTKQFDKALEYISLVIDNDVCQGKPKGYAKNFLAIRRGRIFYKKGDYQKALSQYIIHFHSLQDQLPTSGFKLKGIRFKHLKNYPSSICPIARCYYKLGELDSALNCVDKALEITKLLKYEESYVQMLFLKSNILKKEGAYKEALFLNEEASVLKDSILKVQKFEAIKELETKYNTNEIIKENKFLAQEKELSDAKSFQSFIVMLLIIVIIVAVGSIYWYKTRQTRQSELYKKIEIEQRFLRSQLNPHFIFNSLGAIQNFILSNNSSEAGNYLSRFSKLMRSILESSRDEYITLDDELETLGSYLELQLIRNQNKFTFEIKYDKELELEFINIPPMLLQPIIENSVEHGFKGIKHVGLIEVLVKEENGWVFIDIKDNGKGREASSKTKFVEHKNKSLSTTITKERLELLNQGLDSKISIDIIDLEGETGTLVKIKFPNDL